MPSQWLNALLGGFLIGLSVSLVLLFQGKIAGISGIIDGSIVKTNDESDWKRFFLTGMLLAGFIALALDPSLLAGHIRSENWTLLVAGLLVGFGTRLANGCTSGHGVAGVARLSVRSIVATLTFTLAGFASVLLFRNLGWIL